VVVSRRELLEAERISKKAEVLENIKPGEIREGVVKNITDFGVFLDLDGIDGLLHITDMTWKRIKHPSEMVHLGQKVEVMILSVDKDKGRVALGLKQKESNPWDQIEQKYPPGTRVKGKIVKNPNTIATAIRIGNPASWQQAIDARDSSGGLIDAVTDKEILAAYHLIASREGIFVEPSSAAGLAGLIKYQKAGKLPKNKTIVITVTGHGLKDIPWALEGAKKPVVVPVSVKAAAKALGLS